MAPCGGGGRGDGRIQIGFRSKLSMGQNEVKKNFFENEFSSSPPCFQANRGVSRRLEHWGQNKQQKTRLQIIIDLLTLFPASDFLPLPKQTTDIIYFPGYTRFAVVYFEPLSGRPAYLLTGPHLGYVTSAPASGFHFLRIQKWIERTKGHGSRFGSLLSSHKSI